MSELKEKIRNFLIKKACLDLSTDYSELAQAVGLSNTLEDNRLLYTLLGEISLEEHKRGGRLLSAIVGNPRT